MEAWIARGPEKLGPIHAQPSLRREKTADSCRTNVAGSSENLSWLATPPAACRLHSSPTMKKSLLTVLTALSAATAACSGGSSPSPTATRASDLADPLVGGPNSGAARKASIAGLHDFGGESLHDDAGAAGWSLWYQPLNGPERASGYRTDFREATSRGIRVLARVDNSWEKGKGSMPCRAQFDTFAEQVAAYVASTSGVSIWVIGNETNIDDEAYNTWPTCPDASGVMKPERTTPALYAEGFRKIRAAIKRVHPTDQVAIAPVAPYVYSTETGGREHGIDYQARVMAALGEGGFDAIALHAYTASHDTSLVASDEKDPAAPAYARHLRSYRSALDRVPSWARALPVYITESAPWPSSWSAAASEAGGRGRGWAQAATRDVLEWNASGRQRVNALVFYRWKNYDAQSQGIEGLPRVRDDVVSALALGENLPAPPAPSAPLTLGNAGAGSDGISTWVWAQGTGFTPSTALRFGPACEEAQSWSYTTPPGSVELRPGPVMVSIVGSPTSGGIAVMLENRQNVGVRGVDGSTETACRTIRRETW